MDSPKDIATSTVWHKYLFWNLSVARMQRYTAHFLDYYSPYRLYVLRCLARNAPFSIAVGRIGPNPASLGNWVANELYR